MRSHWILLGIMEVMMFATIPAVGQNCDALTQLSLPDTTITSAQVVTDGSFISGRGPRLNNLPRFCRVGGAIKPTGDSDVQFEIWMPTSGWNGKFQGIGNGGFAGSIRYAALADAVRHGYASASTDTGHQGGDTDAAWALGHPEKIVDFGHRAIHEMTVKAKAIVTAYYSSGPKRS
ncbi:MAG: tannase/feruloyl esterase family alpha/beta hydrolase [Acidobacteriia bacterium]|nr:tannase/feruloyl esterase family alpha/beta hydrolase [Terriglobia bacterium]